MDRKSTAITADPLDGDRLSELRYKAWGETRYALTSLPTDRRFTGQVEEAGIGLYFFNARWYDSALGRWAQPDSIVPVGSQGVQAWDRYAFVNNNPLRYTDPTGHKVADDTAGGCGLPGCEKKDLKIPPITIDSEYGVCINVGDIGCSGTFESNMKWMQKNISMIPYEMSQEKEQIKDTYSLMWGWNMSLSTPGNYGTLGQEEVVILSDGTRATYNYMGEGSSIGIGANTAAYMGIVANLETPDQYKGVAASVGVTVSIGDVGVTIGYFWDSSKPPFTAGNVQGVMVGYSPGAGASVWNSTSIYNLTWKTK